MADLIGRLIANGTLSFTETHRKMLESMSEDELKQLEAVATVEDDEDDSTSTASDTDGDNSSEVLAMLLLAPVESDWHSLPLVTAITESATGPDR